MSVPILQGKLSKANEGQPELAAAGPVPNAIAKP
jgi:hypothetical protein